MDITKALVWMVGLFFLSLTFMYAAIVGEARAKAQQECYKAAQVNPNIKCDGASK